MPTNMKKRILAIGRNKEILETLLRLIHKNHNWQAAGALTDEEAIELFNTEQPDLVLLSNGIDDQSEQTLRSYFIRARPSVIIIQHYGGGSGLLTNEILQALQPKQ